MFIRICRGKNGVNIPTACTVPLNPLLKTQATGHVTVQGPSETVSSL